MPRGAVKREQACRLVVDLALGVVGVKVILGLESIQQSGWIVV
ncbi:hypothetical protein BH11PSE12_BH11PSE12_17590 [soil metagenome]